MALSIVTNAQFNPNWLNSPLDTSLQRLSSGFRITSGADYVISQKQGIQEAGLNSAISNAAQVISMVQTAEGALSEINNLLTQIRGLALNSANSGVNDQNALAANQAQVQNALSTIALTTKNTQFGSFKLFGGASTSGATASEKAILSATGLTTSALSNLSKIDVSGLTKAQAALTAIDTAIAQVSSANESLAAYQTECLEATQQNLQAALQSTTAAGSVVNDANFAAEIANLTQSQTWAQLGINVLSYANAASQLIWLFGGGNGVSGVNEVVYGSHATGAFGANSRTTVNGSSDAIAMGAGSDLAVYGSSDAITATAGDDIWIGSGTGDTITGAGFTAIAASATEFTIKGTGDVVYAGLNDAVTDGGSSDTFKIASDVSRVKISGFGSDPTGIIDLLNGVGGYTTAAAAFHALTSDGAGGSLLSLGAGGSVDLLGVAPSALKVTNFHIG